MLSRRSATERRERDRFRPLAPPVAVWAAFWDRFAGGATAAG